MNRRTQAPKTATARSAGLRRLALDLTPLRTSPPYRRLWLGSALSSVGGQMTSYAVLLQVFLLTRSSLDVGFVGLAIAGPTVVAAVAGGMLVDALDRRKTVLVATSTQAALSAVLAVQAFQHFDRLWLLYLVVGAQAGVGGINAPARRTFMPTLLGRDLIPAGAALQAFSGSMSMVLGPALAGLLTAAAGLRGCYVVDVASFGFSLYGVARLPRRQTARPIREDGVAGHGPRQTTADPAPRALGPRAVGEGFRFIVSTRPVLGALLADSTAIVFGLPVALFPAINAERFGGHPETLGLLTTAVAVGALCGAILSGPTTRVRRPGLGMLAAESAWGVGVLLFGFADQFWLAFLCLVLAGAGDATAVMLRTALIQGVTPDHLRGRVSAAEFAVGSGISQLGNVEAGVVASLTSPAVSAVSGGGATMAGAVLIGLCIPAFVRFRPTRAAGEADPCSE